MESFADTFMDSSIYGKKIILDLLKYVHVYNYLDPRESEKISSANQLCIRK